MVPAGIKVRLINKHERSALKAAISPNLKKPTQEYHQSAVAKSALTQIIVWLWKLAIRQTLKNKDRIRPIVLGVGLSDNMENWLQIINMSSAVAEQLIHPHDIIR